MKNVMTLVFVNKWFLAMCLTIAFVPNVAAKVTYLGENGIYERIFLTNTVSSCNGCHYAGATSYTDLSTYSKLKTYAATADSYIQTGYMPYLDADLNSNEKSLIAQWVDDGALEAQAPTVAVLGGSVLSKTSATLTGSIDPNGAQPSQYVFDYGTTNGVWTNSVTSSNAQENAVGSGGGGSISGYSSVKQVTTTLSNLSCGTTYFWRLTATNGYGSNVTSTDSFTTSACNNGPTITTTALNDATEQVNFQQTIAATDPENDSLTYALTVAPDGMTIDDVSGLINWTPTEVQSGSSFSVTVTATDSGADINPTAQQTFTINAIEVNDAPVITSTAVTTATEDVAYSYTVTVSDDDDNAFTFSMLSSPSGMTIDSNTGNISWTPADGVTDSGTVIVRVSDNDVTAEGVDTQSFTITVTPVNDAPVLTSTAITAATEDTSYTYVVEASDEENDSLTFSLNVAPSGMTIGAASGEISWLPTSSEVSANPVEVAITDGNSTILHNFSINLTGVNDAPVITSDAVLTASEGVNYQYTVMATDEESDPLTFSLTTGPDNMSIDVTTGLLSWLPIEATENYTEDVVVQVSDGTTSVSQAFTIVVSADDDAPFIVSAPVTTATENTAYQYQLTVEDADDTNNGATWVFALLQAPEGMTVNSTGLIDWTPSDQQTGDFTVQIRVRDGADNDQLQDIQTYDISVTAVNDAPVITSSPSTSVVQLEEYRYQMVVVDVDDAADELTFSLTTGPTGMVLSDSGLLTWTPGFEDTDPATVTITVADGGEDGAVAAEQTFVITINAANSPPEITSSAVTSAVEDVLYQYQVAVTDTDDDNNGSDLSFSLTNAPDGMTVSATGLIQWTPTEGGLGAEAIVLTVADGGENGSQPATQTFDISVTAVNDAPVFTSSPSLNVLEGEAWQYQIVVADPDDETSSLTISVSSMLGERLSVSNDDLLSWTPIEGETSSGEIIITVADGGEDGALAAEQKFTVTATSVNQGPTVAAVTSLNATEDVIYEYTLAVTDPDDQNDGESLSYELVSGPEGMTVSNLGVINWTPTEGQLSSGDIVIHVTDGGEDGATAAVVSFVITVTAVNDAPEFISSPVTSATEDEQYSYTLLALDAETAVDDLVFTLVQGPQGMVLTADELTWTPDNNAMDSSVIVSVSDGDLSVEQSFVIVVTQVNDAPEFTSIPVVSAIEDTLYSYDVAVTDVDSANLTLTLLSGPNGMALNEQQLTWTPPEGVLSGQVNLSVTDGEFTELQSFTIAVTQVNDAPIVAELVQQQVTELQTLNVQAVFSDVDSDSVVWSLNNAPTGMSISATGFISWPVPQASAGSYLVDVIADDNGDANNIGSQVLNIAVLLLDADDDLVADYVDNCPLTNNTNQLDTDQNGVGDICDSDDDGDGITDDIEVAFGLDPLDASDALADLDGDGLSNLDEYLACQSNGDTTCSTFNRDNVPPVITLTFDAISVVATGLYTKVDLAENASAVDAVSGEVAVSLDNPGPYRPGRHDLQWTARDTEGNEAAATLRLDVMPLVSLSGTRVIGEGQAVEVIARLNGDAPEYPITVSYDVTGTASGDDISLVAGSVEISAGREGVIAFTTLTDTLVEDDESIIIQLTNVEGAARLSSSQQQQTLMIVDRNVAPELTLVAQQNDKSVSNIFQDQGIVSIVADTFDANSDPVNITWSVSNAVSFELTADDQISFDPTLIDADLIRISVTADDGTQTTTLTKRFNLFASAPDLSATADADGDGVVDAIEGFGDSDGDKIPDYLDAIDEPSQIATKTGSDKTLAASNGLKLALGDLAAAAQAGGATISQQAVVNNNGEQVEDDTFSAIGELYDFEVSGLNDALRQAHVVIPLTQVIPLNATYRKFDGSQWLDFVVDGDNDIASSKAVNGQCPAADSELYQSGLTAFDNCLRLTLSDGGPNDADGEVNGVIVDPGGIAIARDDLAENLSPPALEKPTEQPEGGSSINIAWLGLVTLLLLIRRRKLLQHLAWIKRLRISKYFGGRF